MCCHYTILHRADDYYITLFSRLQTFFREKMIFSQMAEKYETFRLTTKINNDIILIDATEETT